MKEEEEHGRQQRWTGSNLTEEDRRKGGEHSHGGKGSSEGGSGGSGRSGQHNVSEEGRERMSEGGKKGGSK